MSDETKYARILVEAIRVVPGWETAEEIVFSQSDLREAAARLGSTVRNFPDLTYNQRSRAPIPKELAARGFRSIEARGRGRFALVRIEDTIEVGDSVQTRVVAGGRIPPAIRALVSKDEQGILSAANYLDLISDFLGCSSLRLQGHLRTTGRMGQQAEVDELYVTILRDDQAGAVVPIEAKGVRERISRSQVRSVVDTVLFRFPALDVIPLVLKMEPDGRLLLVRFSWGLSEDGKVGDLAVADVVRYKVVPAPDSWPK